MSALFQDIPLRDLSASLVTCQPICNIVVQSMYFADARRRGMDLHALRGTSQNDFLMETVVATAPEVLPPAASFRLSCDAIEFATRSARRWNPISFAGYNYREAGCTDGGTLTFLRLTSSMERPVSYCALRSMSFSRACCSTRTRPVVSTSSME